ncbi:branched-chain amino acid transporter permease [Salininema proteolyticum]|uniref:Branched-chain amino acid transporter permease n=1 Tax=Salininema proteolyticum TaxID=1607685 RepID=A0ABV8U1S4_9ACTN
MPEPWYIAAVLAIVFAVNLSLRAVPFAVLRPLRESVMVERLSVWMPVGVLAILAASTLRGTIVDDPGHALSALLAVGVTVAVHLCCGRRTLLSVGLGTLTYIALVNFAADAIGGALA